MRKLNRNKKEITILENINSSCGCIAYCSPGAVQAKRDYERIQEHFAHTGDPGPFEAKKDI